MMLVRYPPVTPDEFADYEASFDDDTQARREEIDRLAERSGLVVTDDHAIAGGSVGLALLMLAAAVATICALGVLAYVLFR